MKKLTKKYTKKSPKDETEKKRCLLLSVLQAMTVGRVDVDTECSEITEWLTVVV